VIDQGPGVAAKYHQEIFSDYARGNPDEKTQGLGLGLAFVKKIIDMHHGKIELQSEAGSGCRFCISLTGSTTEQTND